MTALLESRNLTLQTRLQRLLDNTLHRRTNQDAMAPAPRSTHSIITERLGLIAARLSEFASGHVRPWLASYWSAISDRIGRATLTIAAAVALLASLGQMGLGLGIALIVVTFGLDRAIGFFFPPVEAGNATSQRGTEGSRRGSQAIWRSVIDAFPDGAVALGETLEIAHFNQATLDMLPRIRPDAALANVTRDPELLAAVDEVAAGPVGTMRNVIMRDRIPVERRIAARVVTLRQPGEVGTPRIVITLLDLTERDRHAEMRADFIANASHELRTPLASLRGFVETLQGPARNDPAARERFLAIMSEQASRMTRLIDDLLSLSRVEMHAHLPPKDSVDLGDVVTIVTRGLEQIATTAKVKIHVEQPDRPAIVRGDRDELSQVIQNLVQNAIKYGRPGGNVWVRLTRDASAGRQRVVTTVTDDGPGIAAEHLPRLTERFYRVNVSASREKGGTGLGLAIVKHILNRHGGELRIASTIGRGSTFTVAIDAI